MSFCDKVRQLAERVILGPDTDKELDDEIRWEQEKDGEDS